MKKVITEFICEFAREHDKNGLIKNIWREPLVTFGDANNKEFKKFREEVHPQHILPKDILLDAKVIIAYFFPFKEDVANSNKNGELSSKEWAMAYEKTNSTFTELNSSLISFLAKHGYNGAITPEAFKYDELLLKSRWSQRHVAKLCGLGTFGINNMLITYAGCCGRVGTLVTNLDVLTHTPISEEYCVYKQRGACGACIKKCPSKALTKEGFNRNLCYELCGQNAEIHVGLGTSYSIEGAVSEKGSYVCGKCVVGVPCAFKSPNL